MFSKHRDLTSGVNSNFFKAFLSLILKTDILRFDRKNQKVKFKFKTVKINLEIEN